MKAFKKTLATLTLISSFGSGSLFADKIKDMSLAYDSFKSKEINELLFLKPTASPFPLDKKIAEVQFGEYLKAMNTLLLNIAATKEKNSELWDDYVSSARVIHKRYEEYKLNPNMTRKQRISFKAKIAAGYKSIKKLIESDKQKRIENIADAKVLIPANKAGYYYNYPKTEIVPAFVYLNFVKDKKTNKAKMYSTEQVLILGLMNQLIMTGALSEIREQ